MLRPRLFADFAKPDQRDLRRIDDPEDRLDVLFAQAGNGDPWHRQFSELRSTPARMGLARSRTLIVIAPLECAINPENVHLGHFTYRERNRFQQRDDR